MDKLYEISERYRNLEELLDNPDLENIKEEIEKSLNAINEEFDLKAENIVKFIKSKEMFVTGVKEEIKRLESRKKVEENQIENLKAYLFEHMKDLNKKKIKGSLFTLSIQKNPASVLINDEILIPNKYKISQPDKIDKKAILADLKQNIKVEGAEIKQGVGLRIK